MIGIFYVLKAANVKLPKASLDAVDIMKLAGGILGGALVKDYAGLPIMDQRVIQQNILSPPGAIKLHIVKCRSILRGALQRHVLLTHVYAVQLFDR